MRFHGISRSSLTINSIWKVRGRRPTLRRTCKVYIPRDLTELDTLRLPATYEEDPYLVQKLKTFTKHKIHHFILVSVISTYLYAGALMFQYLESQCVCKDVWNITQHRDELLNRIYKMSYTLLRNKIEWIQKVETLILSHEDDVLRLENLNNVTVLSPCEGWAIEKSIFYCFTVITTIGYGDIAPCSSAGRAVTTLYSALGIPLMFLVLADLGKLFTKVLKFIYRYFKRFYKTGTFQIHAPNSENKPLQYMTVSWRTVRQDNKPVETKDDSAINANSSQESSYNQVTTLTIHNDELYKNLDFMNPDEKNHKHVEVENDFHLPISLAIAMVIVYMISGMFLFQHWEDWTFFEGFYFVFISMTTIGLGDYTPQRHDSMIGGFIYLVFGLVLNSMCINVVQEKITAIFQKAKVRIGTDTVLNVHALLDDEDHRSRASHFEGLEAQKPENCFGFKMTLHNESISGGNSSPLVQTPKPFYKAIREMSEGEIKAEEGKDFLKVPSQNRFKFYDSPYSTVQDDSQITVTSLKKF